MGYPKMFDEGTPVLVTFSYADSTLATGYIQWFLCGAMDTTNNRRFLTTQPVDAENMFYEDSGNNKDYDITFARGAHVRGTAVINGTLHMYTGDPNTTATIMVELIHYDGTTETSLGLLTSASYVSSAVSASHRYFRFCLKMPLTEKTFKIGDILRVRVDEQITGSGGGSPWAKWFIDPASRQTVSENGSGANIGTDFTVDVPFRIEE